MLNRTRWVDCFEFDGLISNRAFLFYMFYSRCLITIRVFVLILSVSAQSVIMPKKKVVFTVTCRGKNRSVGRHLFLLFFFFVFFVFFFFCCCCCFFATQITEMHILAIILLLHQHKFCVYKGKRKLKLLITCEKIVLFAL